MIRIAISPRLAAITFVNGGRLGNEVTERRDADPVEADVVDINERVIDAALCSTLRCVLRTRVIRWERFALDLSVCRAADAAASGRRDGKAAQSKYKVSARLNKL